MTPQEIFDTVACHLDVQGKRAGDRDKNGSFICLYRDAFGNKCAFGALIPDELYHPDMERRVASIVLDAFPNLPSWMRENENLRLIGMLQETHDNQDWSFMKDRLWYVADEFGLDTEVLKTLSFTWKGEEPDNDGFIL